MPSSSSWKIYSLASLALLTASAAAGIATGFWVLTAVPIGFVFGFCLHKGDLCSASACSEVILARNGGKAFGIWVAIVVSMLGFALLERLGWVALAPMDAYWLNNIVGGALFGAGMVLAGGCVSGCLYKSAAGNINSMAGLVGIPLGALAVQCGPLQSARDALKSRVLKAPGGEALTLSGVTGLEYWHLAVIFAAVTAVAVAFVARRGRPSAPESSGESPLGKILTRPWRHWRAGLVIGLLASIAYVSSTASGRNYPLGVASGVVQTELLIVERNLTHVYKGDPQQYIDSFLVHGSDRKVEWWEVVLVFSLLAGAWVSGRLSGARLLPKPPEQTITAFFGGLLVGTGLAFGFGCTIGHIMSGWALMSIGSLIFGATLVLSAWVTTYFYLRGAKS